jgi:hypothetical protein
MAERKPITKKTRFEVFKRDRFTCQYCGRMSPDVILEVDHIKPVAEGGTNKMINLITSCRDCNRGKGKRKLSDDAELKKQQKELVDHADKREQAEMMIKWRDEMLDMTVRQAESISKYIENTTEWGVSDIGKSKLVKLIDTFTYNEVYEATRIAYRAYYKDTEPSWSQAFNKIGGVCYNRRKQEDNGDL